MSKKKKHSLFSVLQSPHVNKKSQEQFEFNVYSKHLKIQICQLNKFLFFWKWIKTKLFFDIQIKVHFFLNKNLSISASSEKMNSEKFIQITLNKRKFGKKSKRKVPYLKSFIKPTFLKLTDIQGERLLTNRHLL